MTDLSGDLRETSDTLLRDLEVLIALEEEKRGIEPGDERLAALALRVDELAERVLAGTARQRDIVAELDAKVAAGTDGSATSIEAASPRSTAEILADWRSAERLVSEAEPGSPAAMEAEARVDALREEYRRAYDAIRRA